MVARFFLRTVKRGLFIIALCLICIIQLSSFANAAEFGNIGGVPVYPDPNNPRTKSIFVETIDRLETASNAIEVVNYTGEAKTILVYATDSLVSSGGSFGCRQLAEEKKGVGSWVNMSKEEVFLEAGQTEVVPFTITPPTTAEVGENNGCIVIQEKKEEQERLEGESSSISISTRVALRLAVTIPGEVKKELKILGYAAQRQDARKYILKPRVRNIGNVSLDTKLDTYTSGVFGWPSDHHSQVSPILRGVTSDWNIPFEKTFWGGWYRSYFTVEYDKNPSNGIGEVKNPQLQLLTSQTIYFFVPPHPIAALIELVAIAALSYLAYFIYSKFFIIGGKKRGWRTIIITQQTDIATVAAAHNIGWKKLARKNKIKAPYILYEGQKLRVPDTRANGQNQPFKRIRLPFLHPSVPFASWKVITINEATDIATLARQYNIPWKQLAKHNKIKAPYILQQGQAISVPNVQASEVPHITGAVADDEQQWKKIKVIGNQDIETLARQYGMPWKILAKHNKIKAPYIVRAGSEIEVPDGGWKGGPSYPLESLLMHVPYFARRKYLREWEEITIGQRVDNFVGTQNDLESLARHYGVSWKLLAKINNIRPPYILKNGDKIKVPPRNKNLRKH